MVRNCPSSHVFIPVYNCLDEDIWIENGYPLAYLEAGDIEKVPPFNHTGEERYSGGEDEAEVVAQMTPGGEVMRATEGEKEKCGAFEFPVEFKSL